MRWGEEMDAAKLKAAVQTTFLSLQASRSFVESLPSSYARLMEQLLPKMS